MGVQFGIWNRDGMPFASHDLERIHATLDRYGPDGEGSHQADGVTILYRAFHTTAESRVEHQPFVTSSGSILTWDGGLDNRRELATALGVSLTPPVSDLRIVAEAYERWGVRCLEKLLGDWALSLWNPWDQSLLLAKDFLGTRPIYYAKTSASYVWCSVLEPLLLLEGVPQAFEEECLAGWLGSFPAAYLTPYRAIHSVPPASYVQVKNGVARVSKYWDFDPGRHIRYQRDEEYEEAFREFFFRSVERRLRSDSPVLAELSGGMDSSAIVCVADRLLAEGRGETPRVETLSYYDDREPSWNERPFFEKVEKKRGRTGCHIDISGRPLFQVESGTEGFRASPAAALTCATERSEYSRFLEEQGTRVVLSGTGGDESLGGVPTPVPELQNLLVVGRLGPLAKALATWAIEQKKPWMHLLGETLKDFFPLSVLPTPAHKRPAPWLEPGFARHHRAALAGYPGRVRLFGPTPSFQQNLSALEALRRQLGSDVLSADPLYEKRYPCLDRDLLEFLYAIPREQFVRPGERRSLLRRALRGIVPGEILSRKRKAFVARAPLVAVANEWAALQKLGDDMLLASLGVIRPDSFRDALHEARAGRDRHLVGLLRTIALEFWLRNVTRYGLRPAAAGRVAARPSPAVLVARPNGFSAEK